MNPEHDPRCYQNTGVPDDLPANLCDCKVLKMLDKKEKGAERIVVNFEEPKPPMLDHCDRGLHRWAWLTDGRQACGYCGRLR